MGKKDKIVGRATDDGHQFDFWTRLKLRLGLDTCYCYWDSEYGYYTDLSCPKHGNN